MEKNKTQKIIKLIDIILIIIWMITVFSFSNENGEKSSNTSKKITTTVVQKVSKKSVEENKELIETTDLVIRKIAHYTLYTIGGILIANFMYTTEMNKRQKIACSITLGGSYAITDEVHQFFVSERGARITDVGIDTLGVITGVAIYLGIRQVITKVKK